MSSHRTGLAVVFLGLCAVWSARVGAAPVAPAAAGQHTAAVSLWATHPLRGHGSSASAFGRVQVRTPADGGLRVDIGGHIPWSCDLEVDGLGMPTHLVDCVGRDGWRMVPGTIPLRCERRAHDELCRGDYTLVGGHYRAADRVALSRALDLNATWPW